MTNIINLFENSPRLSNNILPIKRHDEATLSMLSDALTKRRIIEQMDKATNLTPEDISFLKDVLIPSLQIDANLILMLRRIA